MPITFDNLPPSGLDRADGSINQFGTGLTAEQIGSLIEQRIATRGPAGDESFLEEDPSSPRYDFSEQTTVQHIFECDCGVPGAPGMNNGTLAMLLPLIQRGQIFTDSQGDVSRVLNSIVERQPPNRARVTVTTEGLTFGLPPDEFSIEPMEINPDLMKHPRYNYGQNGNTATGYGLTAQQKGLIRFVLNQQNNSSAYDAYVSIFGNNNTPAGVWPGGPVNWTSVQQQMAWEIIQKTWRGEDTFYLPALVVTWSRYVFPLIGETLPGDNPGGYTEDPTNGFDVSIPYWFWSINGTDNNAPSNNILQNLATYNTDLYNGGVTYLRKADRLDYVRTWYKYTHTWIGAPTGPKDASGENYIYWDPDLYPQWNGTSFVTTGLAPLP